MKFQRVTGSSMCVSGVVMVLSLLTLCAWAQPVPVTNPSFESGESAPDGWHLSGGEGGYTEDAAEGSRAVYVTGVANSQTSSFWYSDPLSFEPNRLYGLSFAAKRTGGSGGSPISGPQFCNRDLHEVGAEWKRFTSYFMTPSVPMGDRLRLGQWEANGVVAFDDVSLVPVEAVHRCSGDLVLGTGEHVEGSAYAFSAPLENDAANFSRPLKEHACHFNRPRWVFSGDSTVTYVHQVGKETQRSGEVEVNIGYYQGGALLVEACRSEMEDWVPVGTLNGLGALRAAIPETLFPAQAITVRLRGIPKEGEPGGVVNLQVYGYAYRSVLERAPGNLHGDTLFMAVTGADPRVQVSFRGMETRAADGVNLLRFSVANVTTEPLRITPCLTACLAGEAPEIFRSGPVNLPPVAPGGSDGTAAPAPVELELPCEPSGAGEVTLSLDLGGDLQYHAEARFRVSVLHENRYGWTLPDTSDEVGLWWASSGWKVSRTRPTPRQSAPAMSIRAACNESEAAQFVLRPTRELHGLQVVAEPLEGPGGASLPAEAVEILRVGYVPVTLPTDGLGTVAPWPDPLPPMNGPLDLAAAANQPFWICVHIPKDAAPGVYRSRIRLQAEEWQANVPLEVEVFGFSLPDRSTCVSAFGFDPGLVFRYHNVDAEADRRVVFDKYLQLLADHHISIYNPAVFDPIKYTWPNLPPWHGGIRVEDPDSAGNYVLLVADDSETAGVNAEYAKALPVSGSGISLAFRYKTATPGHSFIVTLAHHDASGTWMPGRNNDIVLEGDGSWQQFETIVASFPEGAHDYRLRLWATRYTDAGTDTGSVWFDDVRVVDQATGETLLQEDFAPFAPDAVEKAYTPQFDWTAWDAAMTRAFDRYHFTSLSLPVPGMGGGTFHSRYEPELLGYGENTPEYKAAFNAWCKAAEAHLREKGWLDESFIYWFDEPEPDDYDFVMNGFRKLKEAAPGLNRMLTEEITPELIGGPNIWCPISFNFNQERAAERQAAGEKIWWYICTGPKAPYATLFIDHPGTELRVWLWQTWARAIDGVLVWQTNFWTSGAAYPDTPQNPYEDPMGWTEGYSTPAGTKIPWGNGDGRFLYPPEAAATGQPQGAVFDDPVSSIRLEMLRDGIEDYEYLAILRRLVEAFQKTHSESEARPYRDLLKMPDDISVSLTEFAWDPAPIEARREAVARAIVTLRNTK